MTEALQCPQYVRVHNVTYWLIKHLFRKKEKPVKLFPGSNIYFSLNQNQSSQQAKQTNDRMICKGQHDCEDMNMLRRKRLARHGVAMGTAARNLPRQLSISSQISKFSSTRINQKTTVFTPKTGDRRGFEKL